MAKEQDLEKLSLLDPKQAYQEIASRMACLLAASGVDMSSDEEETDLGEWRGKSGTVFKITRKTTRKNKGNSSNSETIVFKVDNQLWAFRTGDNPSFTNTLQYTKRDLKGSVLEFGSYGLHDFDRLNVVSVFEKFGELLKDLETDSSEKNTAKKFQEIAERVKKILEERGMRMDPPICSGQVKWVGISGKRYMVFRDDTCASWFRETDHWIGDSLGLVLKSDEETWLLRLSTKGYSDKNNRLYYNSNSGVSQNNITGDYRYVRNAWKLEGTVDVFEKFDALLKDLKTAPAK